LTHRLHTTLSQAWSDFTSPFGPSEDSTDRVSGRYQVDTRVSAFGVSAGAEWIGERAQSTFITDALFGQVPVERSNLGLFLEARPDLHRRLIMTGGLRAERIDRQGLVGDGSRPDFDSSVVWSTHPKVAVSWIASEPRDTDRLGTATRRGCAATGIKAPTAFDIASTASPELKPERRRGVEAGVEQQRWRARARIDAALSRNSSDELRGTATQPSTGGSRCKTDN